jgi:predicted esterase YcpF (UPF0227 family)
MSKILYLHGFGSCGEGNKSGALRAYFGEEKILSPDLPYAPQDVITYIEKLIANEKVTLLIGSSLGGFYATYFAEKFSLPAVLLNPSVTPWQTLEKHIGWQERFCDGEVFELKAVYLQQMKSMRVNPQSGYYLVLLQSGDEVLDYRMAKSFYQEHKVVVEYGGTHRFENITWYLSMIEAFRSKNECC